MTGLALILALIVGDYQPPGGQLSTTNPDAISTGVVFEITAYTWTGNRTASGAWPRPGMAACPRRFQFGSRLHVEGVGVVTCTDRGGAIRGNRLDLFVASRSEAIRWGRRKRRVTHLNGPRGPNEPRKATGAPSPEIYAQSEAGNG